VSREPISEERLAALRTMSLAVLVPQSVAWASELREQAEKVLPQLAPVFTELLDEIDEQDDALNASEDEVDTLSARLRLLRPGVLPSEAVIAGVRCERVNGGRWRVRWREDGTQRAETFAGPAAAARARDAYDDLRDRQQQGGAQ
jgi:hypothetical protein